MLEHPGWNHKEGHGSFIPRFTGRDSERTMDAFAAYVFVFCLSSPAEPAFWFGAAAGRTSFLSSLQRGRRHAVSAVPIAPPAGGRC